MKSVYEASTGLDAHMILNLLEQEGIHGRVDGEYLPGGVGELQAINLVRVMVEEADVERARRIIRDWEAIQVTDEAKPVRKSSAGFTGFLLGCLAGGGLLYWTYNSPVTVDGIDVNDDGVLDEKWTYRDGRMSRTESDRNLDGKVDLVTDYDRWGLVKEASSDDDFDGVFETVYTYRDGQVARQVSDLNQDGNPDLRARFRYGNLDEVLITGDGADTRSKRQHFRMGRLVAAEYDADGDGRYDIEYRYDHFGEVQGKSVLTPAEAP
jgi:hypothetical protein